MIRSLVVVKKHVKDVTVFKNKPSSLYYVNKKIFNKHRCLPDTDKNFEMSVSKNKERKWEYDMDGNPYYCDGKAT